MTSLFNLCMATLVNWVIEKNTENLEIVAFRMQGILEVFPFRHMNYLISSVLEKLYSAMSSQEQRSPEQMTGMITLLKICVKASKMLPMDVGIIKTSVTDGNYFNTTMSDMLLKVGGRIREELVRQISNDEETELTVLHYRSDYTIIGVPESLLYQLLDRSSNNLVSLKLSCDLTMPNLSRFNSLNELYLCQVRFRHEPTELTSMPCLSTLALKLVHGIPDNLYRQLTCKLSLPSLKNIYIDNQVTGATWDNVAFNFAVTNYVCRCSEPCLLSLSWLGTVYLWKSSQITNMILSYLGIAREHHTGVIGRANRAPEQAVEVYVTGEFNNLTELFINIEFFRVLLPLLPTTHVRRVELFSKFITDTDVNIIAGFLRLFMCEELVFRGWNHVRTTQISGMLVDVNTVANVVFIDCPDVEIEELSILYPPITFTKENGKHFLA